MGEYLKNLETKQPIIGVITDFGVRGAHYVAEMKGVAIQINPQVKIVDIMHQISPFSRWEAAYVLFTVYDTFPKGTIFVCVVDPGVGTERDIIAFQTIDDYFFIGPDNGIFSYFIQKQLIDLGVKVEENEFFYPPYVQALKLREIHSKSSLDFENNSVQNLMEEFNAKIKGNEDISPSFNTVSPSKFTYTSTFHGRDIMMPVAAHISKGLNIFSLGAPKTNLITLEGFEPHLSDDRHQIHAIIQYIDAFGNIITNIPIYEFQMLCNDPHAHLTFQINDRSNEIIIANTFGGHPASQYLFIPGSSGFMEICCNQASAHHKLDCKTGDSVKLSIIGDKFHGINQNTSK